MYDAAHHFSTIYHAFTPEFECRAESLEAFEQWQQAFRPRLRQTLGLDNMEADLKGYRPTAERRTSEDMGDYIREEWHLWVEPTVPLPFYLLRPQSLSGQAPLILTPHGHNHPHIYVGIAHDDEEAAHIRDGERVREYVLEGFVAGEWKRLSEGSCIGHKRIERFAPAEVSKVRVRVTKAVGKPRIRNLAVAG